MMKGLLAFTFGIILIALLIACDNSPASKQNLPQISPPLPSPSISASADSTPAKTSVNSGIRPEQGNSDLLDGVNLQPAFCGTDRVCQVTPVAEGNIPYFRDSDIILIPDQRHVKWIVVQKTLNAQPKELLVSADADGKPLAVIDAGQVVFFALDGGSLLDAKPLTQGAREALGRGEGLPFRPTPSPLTDIAVATPGDPPTLLLPASSGIATFKVDPARTCIDGGALCSLDLATIRTTISSIPNQDLTPIRIDFSDVGENVVFNTGERSALYRDRLLESLLSSREELQALGIDVGSEKVVIVGGYALIVPMDMVIIAGKDKVLDDPQLLRVTSTPPPLVSAYVLYSPDSPLIESRSGDIAKIIDTVSLMEDAELTFLSRGVRVNLERDGRGYAVMNILARGVPADPAVVLLAPNHDVEVTYGHPVKIYGRTQPVTRLTISSSSETEILDVGGGLIIGTKDPNGKDIFVVANEEAGQFIHDYTTLRYLVVNPETGKSFGETIAASIAAGGSLVWFRDFKDNPNSVAPNIKAANTP